MMDDQENRRWGGDLCQVKPATQDAYLVILALILRQLLELRVLPRAKETQAQ